MLELISVECLMDLSVQSRQKYTFTCTRANIYFPYNFALCLLVIKCLLHRSPYMYVLPRPEKDPLLFLCPIDGLCIDMGLKGLFKLAIK